MNTFMKTKITTLILLLLGLSSGKTQAQTYSTVSEGLTLNFTVSGDEATIIGTPDRIINPRQGSSQDLNSRSLKTIFQHKACTVKLYADSFYKVQKNSHSSFEVICCCS